MSAALSERVGRAVSYPPLSELDELQRREFQEALLEAGTFEDLPGKWQAAIVKAEQNRAEAARRQSELNRVRERRRALRRGPVSLRPVLTRAASGWRDPAGSSSGHRRDP
jgi:hypothetical protein